MTLPLAGVVLRYGHYTETIENVFETTAEKRYRLNVDTLDCVQRFTCNISKMLHFDVRNSMVAAPDLKSMISDGPSPLSRPTPFLR